MPPPSRLMVVQTALPPYALAPLIFAFRHLALLAGRAPIGGAREVALGCFLVARLTADRLATPLPDEARSARSTGARGWLATLTLPAPVRAQLLHCLDLSAAGTLTELSEAIRTLSAAAAEYLEPGSRGELDLLARRLAE